MNAPSLSNAERLREHFTQVGASTKIGGSRVLAQLGNMRFSCIDGRTTAQDAVAFALATIFEKHAEDRDDRPVTGDDTYLFMSSGYDELVLSVKFIEHGGSPQEALRLIAALARLTPDRLYGR